MNQRSTRSQELNAAQYLGSTMIGPRITFILMLILALIPATTVIAAHASSGPIEVPSAANYIYGPMNFTLEALCLSSIQVKVNATQGQQFHIQWAVSTQNSEQGVDFYIGTPSFSVGKMNCGVVGNYFYSETATRNGSVDWVAPSKGHYVFWLVQAATGQGTNNSPVSGTLYILTSSVATASSVTQTQATTHIITQTQTTSVSRTQTSTHSITQTSFVSAMVSSQISATTPLVSVQASTSQLTEQLGGVQVSLGNLGIIAGGAVAAVVASVLAFVHRRKPARAVTSKEAPAVTAQAPGEAITGQPVIHSPHIISTGYVDLDRALEGGIPERFAVVIVGPSYDERDLLLRRMVGSALNSGRSVILISNDIGRIEDLLSRYTNGFYVFSSQADKVLFHGSNLVKLPGIENLSDANLSLSLAIKETIAKENRSKPIIILDILSDVLLRHKSVTTRRWLSDVVGKRKAEGATIVATLNPLATSKEETQSVIDFFDGVIEMFEKTLTERARRFLIIRKMHGQRYSEREILVDKEKLF
jgi:KaiC/GvpD/RAD55 family RecA-like ATPase